MIDAKNAVDSTFVPVKSMNSSFTEQQKSSKLNSEFPDSKREFPKPINSLSHDSLNENNSITKSLHSKRNLENNLPNSFNKKKK